MRPRAQKRCKGGSGPRESVSRRTSLILGPAKPIQSNQGTQRGRYHKGRGREGGGVWVEAPNAITPSLKTISRGCVSFRFEISSIFVHFAVL